MRFTLFLTSALLLLCLPSPSAAAPTPAKPAGVIVKLGKRTAQASFTTLLKAFTNRNPHTSSLNTVKYTYDPKLFNGFAGQFTEDFLAELKDSDEVEVEYIEADGTMHALGSQANPPSWGQRRVGQRKLDLSQPFAYPDSAGAGVDVWVVDTGVQDTHSDFGGRAKLVKSFVPSEANTDMNGHGTHCSGTIASKTYGIAKKANLFGVKVLNGQGSGQYSDVISGIQYVAQNVRKGKTVMSMSLGGPKAQSVDDAVNAAIAAGVVAVVAAGNDGGDACNQSPAGAKDVLAVGATDKTDKIASFSDRGKCVGIFGPGVDIMSLWKGADGATNTISGTSMATPHVAGVAALFMGEKTYSNPKDVYADLKAAATKNAIKGLDKNTTNALLYDDNKPDTTPTEPTDPTDPKDPTDPTDPQDPEDPDDPTKEICKLFPTLPFCKGSGGGGGGGDPGDICKMFPQLCEGGGGGEEED